MGAKKIEMYKTRELEDFEEIKFFPINPETLVRVKRHMSIRGYDPSQPIVVWNGKIVDGRTRRAAALELGIEEIPGFEIPFADDDEAVEYAIHNQVDRRNLRQSEIFNLVVEVDKRNRLKVGRPVKPLLGHHLFDEHPDDPLPTDNVPPHREGEAKIVTQLRRLKKGDRESREKREEETYGKSSRKTGQMVNQSATMVERIRTINDRAQADLAASKVLEALKKDEISISSAYSQIMEEDRKKRDRKILKLEFENIYKSTVCVTVKKSEFVDLKRVKWIILGTGDPPNMETLEWGSELYFPRLSADPNAIPERFKKEKEKMEKVPVDFSTA